MKRLGFEPVSTAVRQIAPEEEMIVVDRPRLIGRARQ